MEFRLASQDDRKACNDFHNRIYNKRRTLTQWEWEFSQRDFPSNVLPYVVAVERGEIVGTQAFIPIKLIDENGIFWTVKSEETLVDPMYRGKKLFEKMYLILFDFLKRHGIHCIWGFTGAHKAFERIGFKIPYTTSQIFFPFSGSAVSSLLVRQTDGKQKGVIAQLGACGYRGAGSIASLYSSLRYQVYSHNTVKDLSIIDIQYLDETPLNAADVTRRFIHHYGGMTIYRDAAYLRWRLFENPYIKPIVIGAFMKGELLGWIAYSIGDDRMGYIVDIMASPINNVDDEASLIIKRLMVAAISDLKMAGALGVRGWSVAKHPFDVLVLDAAKTLGFYYIRRGHNIVLYTRPESTRRESIECFNRWFMTRIYTEGVAG